MLRLIDHLKALGYSNRAARDAMTTGKVWLRGVPTADGGRMVDPADVKIDVDSPRVIIGRDPLILFVDPHLAVVWKPPGMLSVSAPNRRDEGSLIGLVGRKLGRVFAVHRLDEGTSGLLLVARTPKVQEALKAAFEAHDVERRYLALVAGEVRAEPFVIRSQLIRDRGDGLRGSFEVAQAKAQAQAQADPRARVWWPAGPGKPAVTHVRRLGRISGNASLVECTLETGRTHQVRIHLSEAGHPVLGDPLYASSGVERRLHRLGLHAAVLGFEHPVLRIRQRFEAPLADDLEGWVRETGLRLDPPR